MAKSKQATTRVIGFEDRVAEIAEQYHTTPKAIFAKARQKHVAAARAALCHYFYHTMKLSMPEVGGLLDLDSSTVSHAIKRHKKNPRPVQIYRVRSREIARCEGSIQTNAA